MSTLHVDSYLNVCHVRNDGRLPQTQTGCKQKEKFLSKCHEYLTVIDRQEEEES